MKIKEYISTTPIVLDFPFEGDYVNEYLENMDIINFRMRSKYGELPLYQINAELVGEDIRSILYMSKYKYDTLYKTIKLEYNPIWNVEGTETTTTTHGQTEVSNTYADKETTNVQGDRKSSEVHSVFPYDSEDKTPDTETENLVSEVTDKTTEKGRTDKTTTNEHIDTTVLDRRGNIGVTSTQNLIGQERNVANFSFWDIVIGDVVKEISIPFYGGE